MTGASGGEGRSGTAMHYSPCETDLLPILSDQATDDDQLGFAPYAKTLADILGDRHTDTPLTIGVFGDWGRGKTSLMRMVEQRLLANVELDFPVGTVWFNAWLYSRERALWRALIYHVLRSVRGLGSYDAATRDRLDQLESRLYAAVTSDGGHVVLPPGALFHLEGASLPPQMGLDLLRRQAERDGDEETARRLSTLLADVAKSQAFTRGDEIATLDDFRRQIEKVIGECIVNRGRLVVFVDDLDRCLPERAVEVLEAIKLFLDVPGCAFVLGIARQVIEEGIRIRYREYETLDGARYLEKIIQIPFSLPPIAPEAVQRYVKLVSSARLPDRVCEKVFSVGLEHNPRQIKRTLNIFLLLWRLAQNREGGIGNITAVRLAKIVIIQQYHPSLFRLITEQGSHYLIDLEKRFSEQVSRDPEAERKEDDGREVSAGPLHDFLSRGLLRKLLTCTLGAADANFVDLDPEAINEYIYFTRSTVEEPSTAEVAGEEAPLPFEPQTVTIPASSFWMGTAEGKPGSVNEMPQREVSLEAYAIGRYPVTNAEFRRFVADGGYDEREYWTDAGWTQKESEYWTQPRFWGDADWSDNAQPVVGISWYEALAYCRWLTEKTEKGYRLPTEAEWEKAARGDKDRRGYPWGDAWDPQRCNNRENGPDHTTPVGQFSPAGDSPFGASDMAGQVWEWCSTRYGGTGEVAAYGYPYDPRDGREDLEGEDTRVLRGGSWLDGAAACRCSYRFRHAPRYGDYNRGFRVARSIP